MGDACHPAHKKKPAIEAGFFCQVCRGKIAFHTFTGFGSSGGMRSTWPG